jgi:hypothetical protein
MIRKAMELPIHRQPTTEAHRLPANVPIRVTVAFDQLTDAERDKVLEALGRIERAGLEGSGVDLTRLGGPTALYALRVTPTIIVIVRAEPGQAVEVRDIVQPATLENFAHAG